MIVVVDEEVIDTDVVPATDVVEMNFDGVPRNGAVLVVLLQGEGGSGRRVFGDLQRDPTLIAHVVTFGVEYDRTGAIGEVEGLADAIRILAVVLRGAEHEKVIA